jgi:hypothetical protein
VDVVPVEDVATRAIQHLDTESASDLYGSYMKERKDINLR